LLREVVEGLAARLAAGRVSARLADQLRKLLVRQRSAADSGDIEQYSDLDLTFHQAIWDAAGSVHLRRVAETFAGQVGLLISSSARVPGRLQVSLGEHEEVASAISAGDSAAAEAAMRQHVRQARLAIQAHLQASSQ
jgi:DNA-binding GntR family transcriptional regulator